MNGKRTRKPRKSKPPESLTAKQRQKFALYLKYIAFILERGRAE